MGARCHFVLSFADVTARILTLILVGALPSALTPSPLAGEAPRPSSSTLRSVRKEPASRVRGIAGPRETLGTLVNVHTRELCVLDRDEPDANVFSAFVSDRTTGEARTLDARLLAVVRDLAARHGHAERIEIVSGYRSPKLNEMLRKKGHHVASHSQHSLGQALDFRLVGVSPGAVHDELDTLAWPGGIGQYDGASDRFVHADVGRKRVWRGR
jgi:uncharacterized protein YcbK (DUF882 family)